MMPSTARRGATLPAVLILVALASAGVFGAVLYRRHATKDFLAALHRTEALEVGAAAIHEVCSRRKLEALFNLPENRQRLAAATAGGTEPMKYHLAPAPLDLAVPASVTAEYHRTQGTFELDPVRLDLVEYRTQSANQGTLRASVSLRRTVAGRPLEFAVALDYPVQFRTIAGRLLVLVPQNPKGRLSS